MCLNEMSQERLIKFREALQVLGMSEVWLRKQVAAGTIPHYKLGRSVKFRRSDLESYLDRRRRG